MPIPTKHCASLTTPTLTSVIRTSSHLPAVRTPGGILRRILPHLPQTSADLQHLRKYLIPMEKPRILLITYIIKIFYIVLYYTSTNTGTHIPLIVVHSMSLSVTEVRKLRKCPERKQRISLQLKNPVLKDPRFHFCTTLQQVKCGEVLKDRLFFLP